MAHIDQYDTIIACTFTILVAMHADKKKERGLHVAIPAAIGVIGYALLYALRHQGVITSPPSNLHMKLQQTSVIDILDSDTCLN